MSAHRNTRRRWVLVLSLSSGLLLALGLSLNPLARWQTRKRLKAVRGLEVSFLDAGLRIFPAEYRISRLKVLDPKRGVPEPLFYAEHLSVRFDVPQLLTGNLVVRVEADGVKVVLEQPKPGSDSELPSFEELIPTKVVFERVHVTEGEVLYVWTHHTNAPSLWFSGIEATLENLGSRRGLVRGLTTLEASGQVAKQGRMTARLALDPWANEPTFVASTRLSGFQVAALNALLESQKGVKLTPGLFAATMSFESRSGRVTGTVVPSLESEGVAPSGEGLGAGLRALLAKATMTLAPQAEGTKEDGTILVRDDLTASRRPLVLVVERVVEHGLLLGLEEGLKRVHAGGTKPGKRGARSALGSGT